MNLSRRLVMLCLLPSLFLLLNTSYWFFYKKVPLTFLIYLIVLPLVFAATIVPLAGKLKLWKWSEPLWAPLYAWCGYSAFSLMLIGDTLSHQASLKIFVLSALHGAVMWAMIGTLFDLFAMDAGFFTVYNRAYYKKLGTIHSVGSYGFRFFSLFGFFLGLASKLGHFYLVENSGTFFFTYIKGAALLVLPFLLYLFWMVQMKKKNRPNTP